MNVGSVEDRLAIRELVDAFAVRVTAHDADFWSEVWAPQGTWILPSEPQGVHGKEKIRDAFKIKMAPVENIHMTCTPSELNIQGDRGTGKTFCRETIYLSGGVKKVLIACFHDEYIKIDGQWLFLTRDYKVFGVY